MSNDVYRKNEAEGGFEFVEFGYRVNHKVAVLAKEGIRVKQLRKGSQIIRAAREQQVIDI